MSFSSRFTHGLLGETKEKSKLELIEDSVTRQTKIQLLRDKMVFRPDLPFQKTDDKNVLRFLQVRKFDEERVFQLLCAHIEFKGGKRDLFDGLCLEEIRDVLEEGIPGVLESTDSNGSRVLVLFQDGGTMNCLVSKTL